MLRRSLGALHTLRSQRRAADASELGRPERRVCAVPGRSPL